MKLVTTVGGASGPLYGTLFMALGKALPAEPTRADVAAAFEQAIAAVKARGKSEVGQKTMLDVLVAGAGRRLQEGADAASRRRGRAPRGARRRRRCGRRAAAPRSSANGRSAMSIPARGRRR